MDLEYGKRVRSYIQTSNVIRWLWFLIISLIAIGTAGYALIKGVGIIEAFTLTLETLAFSHYEESGPARILQLFLMIYGAVIVWFVIWTFMDYAIEGKFQEYARRIKIMKKARQMKNHYIICGGGRVGEHLADMLKAKKQPYIIIDSKESTVFELHKKGLNVMEGDVLAEQTLIDAGIKKAKAIISVLAETEKNILVTLTAKEIMPNIMVYTRSDRKELVKKLKTAGAEIVVMPEFEGAEQLAKAIFQGKIT